MNLVQDYAQGQGKDDGEGEQGQYEELPEYEDIAEIMNLQISEAEKVVEINAFVARKGGFKPGGRFSAHICGRSCR